MSNFSGATKTAATTATAAAVNADRLDVIRNAGDYATSGGSSNAYTLAVDAQYTAYSAGDVFKFKSNFANTTTATLNVNSIGAKTIKRPDGTALIANDIISGQIVTVIYDGTDLIMVSVRGNKPEVYSYNAGETIAGATLPVPVYQDTSDGEFYACDANVTTKLNFRGFAISDGTNGNPINVQTAGIVSGFSGLTKGKYYVSDTVGTIATTPGTYAVLVGLAVSATEILILQNETVSFIDSNVTQTDTQTASASKSGTFTINTPRRARLIKFTVTVIDNLQSGSNSTRVRTYNCHMDLINQRIIAQLLYSANNQNITSAQVFVTGAANLQDLIMGTVQAMTNSVISVDNSGGTSFTRIDSIVSTENAITFSYTLNSGSVADDCAIALTSVIVLG